VSTIAAVTMRWRSAADHDVMPAGQMHRTRAPVAACEDWGMRMGDDQSQLSPDTEPSVEQEEADVDAAAKAAVESLNLNLGDEEGIVLELQQVNQAVDQDQLQEELDDFLFGLQPLQDPRMIQQDPNPELDDLRQAVQRNIADSSLEERTYNVNRWSVVVAGLSTFGVLASGAFAGYVALRSANNSHGPVVPSGVNIPLITSLLQQWADLPDSDFWNAVAAYIQANETGGRALTLADQYQFLTYVMDLWPLTQPFEWSGSDATTARDYFLAQYADAGNDTAAMYTAVAGYTYQGQPLPRAVAATVLQWAIAQLIVDLGAGSSHARLSPAGAGGSPR
jgi:hypothetical protein